MSQTEYLDRVASLLPRLRERAPETEELGRIPEGTIADLTDIGALAGLQPRRHGGLELDPATFFQGVVMLASACPSTGWIASVLGVHPWEVGCMHPDAQADVWGDTPNTLVSSSYAPTGSAQRGDDGDSYTVSGWWGFSSGVDHAGWALLAAVVRGEEAAGPRVFLVPKADFEIDHTSWQVAGLAGTGSKSLQIERAAVPAYRTHLLADFNDPNHERAGWAVNDAALYRCTFLDVFSWGIAGPALGAATGFADEWVHQSRDRIPGFGGPGVADKPELQQRLADGLNRIDLLTRSMISSWSDLHDTLVRGERVDDVAARRHHYLGSRTIADSLEAVLIMFANAGGGAMARSNPLQRFVRDLLAMRNHPVANLERFSIDAARAVLRDPTLDD